MDEENIKIEEPRAEILLRKTETGEKEAVG
jgi:hypothetical protein